MRTERTLARPRLKGAWAVSHLLRSLRCGHPVALLLRNRLKALLLAGLQPMGPIGKDGVSLLPSRLEHSCFPLRLLAEFGVVFAQSPKALRQALPEALEDASNE